ncbi:uncharacterized protein LOC130715358 [Lotus japonicus]|uniref:uncharacterized protein LOC130715358 n=1 Tax=Lotus japonicus TaxID=34305 RepID=UPI0025843B87|nr:uncharacterized protein LOC130715358 [Lotus japonicus]
MCIAVFMWQAHPKYPFILLLNRDEFHSRPTDPLAWWPGETILAGRDALGGGTWLGSTRNGRVAFLTNFRELPNQNLPSPNSRGHLPLRFLQGNQSPEEFAEQVLKEAHQYNGFNLILADMSTSSMVYVFNRPKPDLLSVAPGVHVLTNSALDATWPKAERLRHSFKELIDQYGESEFPIKEMVEKLMTNTIKDEEYMLPGIYPPERELPVSSVFVDVEFPLLGRYGTRSSSALLVKSNKEATFYEKHLDQEKWKEKMVTYQIIEAE